MDKMVSGRNKTSRKADTLCICVFVGGLTQQCKKSTDTNFLFFTPIHMWSIKNTVLSSHNYMAAHRWRKFGLDIYSPFNIENKSLQHHISTTVLSCHS